MNHTIIDAAVRYIQRLFSDNTDGHDTDHSLRVYRNALKIAEAYPDSDRTIIALASLLHDTDDHKLFCTDNNENARWFLESAGVSPDQIDRICDVINAVSFSRNRDKRPESIEAMIVQDADRLDAIGAVGIARTFAFGGSHGRTLDSSIDHFHEKLLLLKDLLNTQAARSLAEKRHTFMLEFLDEYESEITL